MLQPPVLNSYSSSSFSSAGSGGQPSYEENSILGSGNFDILKGGTFYDSDDYRLRPYR